MKMLDDVSFVWLLVCGSEKMKTDLEADFSDGGSVNDGEHLDEVLEKETVKESFVSLLKRRQVDVFCNRRLERSFPLLQTAGDAKERGREEERGWGVPALGEGAGELVFDGLDFGREKAAEVKSLSFLGGKGRSLVGRRHQQVT